jgi:hypothetical protein
MKPSSYRFSYRCAPGENEWDIASFLELHRNFLEWIFSWIAYWKRSLRGMPRPSLDNHESDAKCTAQSEAHCLRLVSVIPGQCEASNYDAQLRI